MEKCMFCSKTDGIKSYVGTGITTKKVTYSFCYNCYKLRSGAILLFPHGLFGKKKMHNASLPLNELIVYSNLMKDTICKDMTFKEIIETLGVPIELIDFLFSNNILKEDELGLKDEYGSYGINIYSHDLSDKEKIKRYKNYRMDEIASNRLKTDRIKNQNLLSEELPWKYYG